MGLLFLVEKICGVVRKKVCNLFVTYDVIIIFTSWGDYDGCNIFIFKEAL